MSGDDDPKEFHYPYFAQEAPAKPVVKLIADHDISEPYELDSAAVFACEPSGYLVVFVSGCSCWPDRGSTKQELCASKSDVDRALSGDWRALLQKCQDANWGVSQ